MTPPGALTRDPLPRLVRRLAIPSMVAFASHTAFNLTDTWFAGRISTDALAGLGASFPMFFLIIAVGAGLGTGATALVARALGAGRLRLARHLADQILGAALLVSLALLAAGWAATPAFFRMLGENSLEFRAAGTGYLRILFLASPFFLSVHVLNAMVTAAGDTTAFRNAMFCGAVLNLGLDPWFMFGGFGLPALGLSGAAWSTAAIQAAVAVFMFRRARRHGFFRPWRPRALRPRLRPMRALVRQGVPAGLNLGMVGVGILIITWFASRFGQEAVAAYGAATRIEQVALLPCLGLSTAALALSGQNFGARRPDRVYAAWASAILHATGFLAVVTGPLLWAAPQAIRLFSDDPEVIRAGASYLRIAIPALWAYAVMFISTSTLQGLHRPMIAIWTGLWRQVLVPIPLMLAFTRLLGFGVEGVWTAVVISTWSGALLVLLALRREFRKVLPMP